MAALVYSARKAACWLIVLKSNCIGMPPGLKRMIMPALVIGLSLITIFYFTSIAAPLPVKNRKPVMNVSEAIVYAKKYRQSNSEITISGLFAGETKQGHNKTIWLDDMNGKHPGRLVCEFSAGASDYYFGEMDQAELSISGVLQIMDTSIVLTGCQLIVINNINPKEIKFPF